MIEPIVRIEQLIT